MAISEEIIHIRMKSLISELGSLHNLYSVSMFVRNRSRLELCMSIQIKQQDIANQTLIYHDFERKLKEIMEKGGIILSFSGFPDVMRVKAKGYILCNGDWSVCSSEVIELLSDMIL